MSSVVLDASALMAFLRCEPGSDVVGPALANAAISTVNLSEVLAKAAESPNGFELAKNVLRGLQLRVVGFDEQQAVIAAGLRPVTRPLGLSLGDRCCLALGLVEEIPILTADRQWSTLRLGSRFVLSADSIVGLPAVIRSAAAPHRDIARRPHSIMAAGPAAGIAWDEFFGAMIRNRHTRPAYLHAVMQFLAWAESRDIALERITPGMVGAYFDQHPGSLPTKKLHLSALRSFCDVLVNRHVLILNPAASVRAERYQAIEGKTPEITRDQARTLLSSIDTSRPVGLRDKALIATLIYTAARAGAVASLRLKDFAYDGTQYTLRFMEKGGKSRAIPVRHDLQTLLLAYLASFDLLAEPKDAAFFRSVAGRTGELTIQPICNIDVCRMIKRRLGAAGLPSHLSPHSFRVATVTDLLTQGVSLEDVQYLAGHADPRTTRLYDRRQKQVTRNTVERISI